MKNFKASSEDKQFKKTKLDFKINKTSNKDKKLGTISNNR